jgi:ferritin-like metal-binding protein YciE
MRNDGSVKHVANEPRAADAKLVQYLNEAYGKEKQLETDLQAHIAMTQGRDAYKKRLQEHLKETKAQARNLERRIKKLGGKADVGPDIPGSELATDAVGVVTSGVGKAKALARGPLHTLRGTGLQDKLLKNAQTEFSEEHHEIAMYTAIEALAETVNDPETAKLAKEHRRQEERMAAFLQRLIPQLTKDVARAEIPAAERRTRSTRRRGSRSRARSGASAPSGSGSSARSRSASSSRSRSGGSTSGRSGSSARGRSPSSRRRSS